MTWTNNERSTGLKKMTEQNVDNVFVPFVAKCLALGIDDDDDNDTSEQVMNWLFHLIRKLNVYVIEF